MKLYSRHKQQQQQQQRVVPRRLDRRNALKNIDYDASTSSYENESTHRTRSLDISLADRTSFRIEGIEGEFDLICRSLGLGPDDFSISTADWEARRSNSSPPISGVNFPTVVDSDDDDDDDDDARSRLVLEGESGIKGLRPPILAPPPAARCKVIVDDVCSNWDLIKSFAEVEISGMITSRIDTIVSPSGSLDEDEDEDGDESNESRVGTIGSPAGSPAELQYSLSPNGSLTLTVSFQNWQKGELLGRGSFGTVYEGFNEFGFFFAVKEVPLHEQDNQGRQSIIQLEQEISLLSQFHHENIVRYLGTDTADGKLYIFLELVTKGSLAKLYQKYVLRDSQVSAYTRQILSGLNYLHERKVVHRDIKCANILVDASGSVKLADFGLAKATTLNDIKSCKGTPFWMAPEVVNNRAKKGYGLAADIWSLGCTVLEMLTRNIPYYHLEGMQALFRIGRGEPPEIPDTLSVEARDFVVKCLQVDPNDRPTAGQLLDHPFVKRRTSLNSTSPLYNGLQLEGFQ